MDVSSFLLKETLGRRKETSMAAVFIREITAGHHGRDVSNQKESNKGLIRPRHVWDQDSNNIPFESSHRRVRLQILSNPSPGVASTFRFDSLVTPGLDWTRIFISLTAGAGTR